MFGVVVVVVVVVVVAMIRFAFVVVLADFRMLGFDLPSDFPYGVWLHLLL